jgi:hypothetical protein
MLCRVAVVAKMRSAERGANRSRYMPPTKGSGSYCVTNSSRDNKHLQVSLIDGFRDEKGRVWGSGGHGCSRCAEV